MAGLAGSGVGGIETRLLLRSRFISQLESRKPRNFLSRANPDFPERVRQLRTNNDQSSAIDKEYMHITVTRFAFALRGLLLLGF